MINHTFSHIPGIGVKTEKILWENNIRNWNDFVTTETFQSHLRKFNLLEQNLKNQRIV